MSTTQETSQKPRRAKPRGWGLGIAIGALMALLATAGWAGYKLLDPAKQPQTSTTTCYSTGMPESSAGVITTPPLLLKEGEEITVESIELIDAQNFRVIGTGIQHRVGGIGTEYYPEPTGSTEAWLAWTERAELPAVMGSAHGETPIIAVEPIALDQDAAATGVRYVYTNRWNLRYSMDAPFAIQAKANCLLEDPEE